MPVPFDLRADPIPRHSRLVVHDSDPPPRNPIEQRRFSNIRTPNYGDKSWHTLNMGENRAFVNGNPCLLGTYAPIFFISARARRTHTRSRFRWNVGACASS